MEGPKSETDSQMGPTDNPQREVILKDEGDVDPKYQLNIEVEMLRTTITSSNTAEFQVTVTNSGPERLISIHQKGCQILNRWEKISEPPGIWLEDPDVTPSGDKWVADKPSDEPRAFFMYECGGTTWKQGESKSFKYAIWHDYEEPGYLNPGTYKWDKDIKIRPLPDSSDSDEKEGSTVSWNLTLELTSPE